MRHFWPISVWSSRSFVMNRTYANSYPLDTLKSTLLGFIELKLSPNSYYRRWSSRVRFFTSSPQEFNSKSSEKVLEIGQELCGLTLLEVADLTEELRKRRGMQQVEMAFVAEAMPGMKFGMTVEGKGDKEGSKEAEVATEKSVFNLILEGFDPASKLKAIKEVRSLTSLGLKEAKELVEKAPTVLKMSVTKEDAEKIIQTMKEIGARVIME